MSDQGVAEPWSADSLVDVGGSSWSGVGVSPDNPPWDSTALQERPSTHKLLQIIILPTHHARVEPSTRSHPPPHIRNVTDLLDVSSHPLCIGDLVWMCWPRPWSLCTYIPPREVLHSVDWNSEWKKDELNFKCRFRKNGPRCFTMVDFAAKTLPSKQ